jgi:MFS family permease
MVLYYDRFSIFGLYVMFFLMGVTVSSVGTIAMIATKEYFPTHVAGTAMGTLNIFPFIGGLLFQPLLGFVLDSVGKINGYYLPSGYRSVVLLLFITSLLALISIMFSKETMKDREM